MERKRAGESVIGRMIRYNRECESKIRSALDDVRRYKSRTLLRERCGQMDQEIRRAYYGKAGIRFYGRTLADYVRLVLPDVETVEEMRVGGYNSAIYHMRERLARLTESYATFETAGEPVLNETALLSSIGYESCRAEIAYFREERGRGLLEQRKEAYARLRRHVEANKRAATEALRCRAENRRAEKEGQPEPALEELALLEAMRSALDDTRIGRLAEPGELSAEEYRKELERFAERVQEELLDRFVPPEEQV